jgi:hypothetical protein
VAEVTTVSRAETIVGHPAGWCGADLQNRSEWIHHLVPAELSELDHAVSTLRSSGKPLAAITADDFPLTRLSSSILEWRNSLQHGLGFVLVRGFPVHEYSKDDAALAYWIIGRHLGEPVTQSAEREVLGHVHDTGADPMSKNTRLFRTRADLAFHTDGADIIGLFCLRTAKAGGVSRITSSVTVFNEVVRRRPDLAPLLFEKFPHHVPGRVGSGQWSSFDYPIVAIENGSFRMFFIGWYIRNAAGLEGVAQPSPRHLELVDLIEKIAAEPGIPLDMSFSDGDMQFLKNSVILHARTGFEDWDEPDKKRHLLRLWLAERSFADGDERLRAGFSSTELKM